MLRASTSGICISKKQLLHQEHSMDDMGSWTSVVQSRTAGKHMITTPSQQSRTHTRMALLAICLGYFMTTLDLTVVNVALVNIKEQLSANVTGLQWIVDGYSLVFASFLLIGGALGDKIGGKKIFLTGLALFTLASALCSVAPSLLVLQIARALQGLGAALLVPTILALEPVSREEILCWKWSCCLPDIRFLWLTLSVQSFPPTDETLLCICHRVCTPS